MNANSISASPALCRDNPRNQDSIGEKELLVVSFGTSYNENRCSTIGAIEAAMERAFPDYSVRRGFTSQIILNIIKKRDGLAVDNVRQALDRAVANGVRHLVVQPTHMMDGFEYHDMVEEIEEYRGHFDFLSVGAPLLSSEADFRAVADALIASTAAYDDGETAICFMGHGTEAASNKVYPQMQRVLQEAGKRNCFIGTVEASPSVEDLLMMVQQGSYQRVLLQPMMIVAGDHANNDMAGEGEDSWKSIFARAGYHVECNLLGLGALPGIQNLLVQHARTAMEKQ